VSQITPPDQEKKPGEVLEKNYILKTDPLAQECEIDDV